MNNAQRYMTNSKATRFGLRFYVLDTLTLYQVSKDYLFKMQADYVALEMNMDMRSPASTRF